MSNAKWIRYWGDYEIYHSLKSVTAGCGAATRGDIRVEYANGRLTVLSDLTGGVLIANGQEYPIEAGVPLTVNAEI